MAKFHFACKEEEQAKRHFATQLILIVRRQHVSADERFTVFFVVWIALALGNAIFLWLASPEAKRTWFPRLVVLGGVLFAGFLYWIMRSPQMLAIFVPATAFITFLNVRFTKFCSSCGAYHQSIPPFYTVRFCRKCGLNLS